jgi:putative addiction module component (TIGR02574 family)
MKRDPLLEKILKLPRRSRARYVRELLASLEDASDGDAEEAWLEEIRCRVAEVRSGKAKLEDWETVRARIKARLAAMR